MIKKLTGVPCPTELTTYGGTQVPTTLFEHMTNLSVYGHGCFPGGHASAGFALLCLPFMYGHKIKYYIPGLILGFTLGIYQMMKGDHFLIDTLVTMELALIVNAIIALILRLKPYHEKTSSSGNL